MTKVFIATLVLIVITSINSVLQINLIENNFSYLGFWNYLLTEGMLVVFLARRIFYKIDANRQEWIAFLALFNISCFSLNNEVNLFSPQAIWVYGSLGGLYAFLIVDAFWKNAPIWFTVPRQVAIGLGLFISGYFSIYMFPLFPVGFLAIIVFGLGLHVFIPLALFITLCIIVYRNSKDWLHSGALALGTSIPMIAIIVLAINWSTTIRNIKTITESPRKDALPTWVSVAQIIPKNTMTKTLVTGDFRYDIYDHFYDLGSFGMPTSDQGNIHDPVVNIAHLIAGNLPLTENDRLQLLKTSLNDRHHTERKLWTGRDLSIQREETTITLYPSYRLAYTEKTFLIKNNSWDRNETQEALFTFYLPEGATSSSMSLWVNGEERKSRLTTRSKADNAYVQIVGRERRDPALLHWQEGNRLTLTVFPCTNAEMRKVKIGFTIPLQLRDQALYYQSIKMEGPRMNGFQYGKIKVDGQNNIIERPGWLKQINAHEFEYTGWPKKNWSISMESDAVSSEGFSFNGSCYKAEEIMPTPQPFVPKNLYLDINQSWTLSEVKSFLIKADNLFCWAYVDGEFQQINMENIASIYEGLSQKAFSVFPIHKIDRPLASTLITKNGKGTPYYKDLVNYFTKEDQRLPTLKVFCIGNDLPGYLRHFEYNGSIQVFHDNALNIQSYLDKKQFPVFAPLPGGIAIPENGTQIVQVESCTSNHGPDHLLRLHHYNSILGRYGNLLPQDSISFNSLLEYANEAFVVSPISSLIVLETQKDYERFDINVNERSLKNAASKKAGAVPEPHEWAIIVLCSLILLWFYRKG